MIKAQTKRTLRTFGIGAGCGFIVGAALTGILITKYAEPRRAAAERVHSISATDGLADVDSPVLEVRATASSTATGTAGSKPEASLTAAPPETLARRELEIPVEGVKRSQLVDTFEEKRGSQRIHEALDILAPRNTPVKAVEDGTIARLFESKAGGITIYQFDPTEQYCYYYAHLERYASGLNEGDQVKKGQVIGYVGTSGNAPKETPHLHFAVFKLTSAKRWWEGTPINPYTILH
jgi:murein DD-endopeptidase MepM/ murein hydrolase activator NlpD